MGVKLKRKTHLKHFHESQGNEHSNRNSGGHSGHDFAVATPGLWGRNFFGTK
jgi:hypothetical protein